MDPPFLHWYEIIFLVVFHVSYVQPSCHGNRFLPGGFFFATGRNMVENHTLSGYVFETFTVSMPVECFRKCQADCRCISFNYLTTGSQDNCKLNEENKYLKPSALERREGSQYYDLVIDYNVVVSEKKKRLWPGRCLGSNISCTQKILFTLLHALIDTSRGNVEEKDTLWLLIWEGYALTLQEKIEKKNKMFLICVYLNRVQMVM